VRLLKAGWFVLPRLLEQWPPIEAAAAAEGRNPRVPPEWLQGPELFLEDELPQPEWPPGCWQGNTNSRLFLPAAGQLQFMGCFHTSRAGFVSEGAAG